MRRLQALDAPALLIDENRSMPTQRIAHSTGEAANLVRTVDVAGKEDDAPGLGLLQEPLLKLGQFQPGEPANEGARAGRWQATVLGLIG
jgi:hypothetical protein